MAFRPSPADVPIATYRLQLNGSFGFQQAAEIVPYLARLGISHVYASPFLKARAGSTHGYDIVDYNQLNPELGDWQDFEHLSSALRRHGMGLILDFVPNHMGVGKSDNPWWLDVLEWGQASPFAGFFDIDWSPPRAALAGKVLLPLLGTNFGSALTAGKIELKFDPTEGSFSFWYFEHRLPLAPWCYATAIEPLQAAAASGKARRFCDLARELRQAVIEPAEIQNFRDKARELKASLAEMARHGDVSGRIADCAARFRGEPDAPASYAPLAALLQQQNYRLAYWRVAADEINYRRFFDISDLAGIRMNEARVFDAAHELIGRLFASGMLQGLRIDHVDGLADPEDYCRKLRAFVAGRLPRRADGRRASPYILVEKILAHHERLRRRWRVAGTTGYDHIAKVNGLFVEPSGLAALELVWRRFTGCDASYEEELYRCRRFIIGNMLTSELATLTNLLVQISEDDWFTRDFTRQRLREGLVEIAAAFPVYRTYVGERGLDAEDRRDINWAVEQAKRRWVGVDIEILDHIGSVLTLDVIHDRPALYRHSRDGVHRFLARFQQYTSAVAAKAVEDTLFYRFLPLVSVNEVGCDPRRPATSLNAFHRAARDQAKSHPHAMLASETHDAKRAEDVRARLNVLSELPGEWERRVVRWRALNRRRRHMVDGRSIPSLNDEYLLYQTIVGSWPGEISGLPMDEALSAGYRRRLKDYAVKASREAKLSTSWMMPDETYEQGLVDFVDRIFSPADNNPFLASVARFVARLAAAGRANGLGQLVLKSTLPGVPDFYQGSENWDLSLVDPDNRRPVDFAHRWAALERLEEGTLALPRSRLRGEVKLQVMRALLKLRTELADLFRDGSYHRLEVVGPMREKVVTYARRHNGAEVVVVVSRFLAGKLFAQRGGAWPGGALFRDNWLIGANSTSVRDVLAGQSFNAIEGKGYAVDRLLNNLPVAVLVQRGAIT